MERGWLERLDSDEIVLIDGGMGSELERRGIAMSPVSWSGASAHEHAATLRAIHADYIRAGAEIITTNTFGTSRFVLAAEGLADHFADINRRAVDAALAARATFADRRIAIAGSMSCFPPRFDRTAYPPLEIARDAYRELATLLEDCGVDLIALEMIEDIEHGEIALSAALETGLPVWLGVSARISGATLVAYDDPQRPLEDVLAALVGFGPTVVNVMHTPPDAVAPALKAVARHWPGPRGVYPELSGDDPSADASPSLTPAALVEQAVGWVAQGARLLGGCCGAGPAHIAALAAARTRLEAARASRG